MLRRYGHQFVDFKGNDPSIDLLFLVLKMEIGRILLMDIEYRDTEIEELFERYLKVFFFEKEGAPIILLSREQTGDMVNPIVRFSIMKRLKGFLYFYILMNLCYIYDISILSKGRLS